MTPLEIALGEYGNEVWPDIDTNPEVLKYFHETGFTFIDEDETPWCAAFLNQVLKQCGKPQTHSLLARSFLKIGIPVDVPDIGDIVVFWRISREGIFGHTGIYIRETKHMIWVLGGNQDGRVTIKPFPKTQLLGYRKVV